MGTRGRRGRRLGIGLMAATAVLLLVGCHWKGGGTLRSATGRGQATFAFDLSCPPGTKVQSGTIVYLDPPAGVKLEGRATGAPSSGDICGKNSDGFIFGPEGDFNGTYMTLDGTNRHGTFGVTVYPGTNTPANPSGGAYLSINLRTGPYAGYHNSGTVIAGTIQPVGGPNA
jgi:hypothetical protein